MKFDQPEPHSRSVLVAELESADAGRVSRALISLALHEADRAFVEAALCKFLQHDDAWIRGAAAIAVGHVARLHRDVDRKLLVPMLETMLADPVTAGKAQDALGDIETFVQQR